MHTIVARYEKGHKFLDLCKSSMRSLDDDGRMVDDEVWEVVIWDNEPPNYNIHKCLEFANEFMAMLFINSNGWTEQVQ